MSRIKSAFFVAAVLTVCLLSGCTDKEKAVAPVRKVIIDMDGGADDASALILAAKSSNIEILGVTVLSGNVDLDQATKNALASLEIVGCDAPVYRGATHTYTGEEIEAYSVYGKDGMGDKDLVHPVRTAEKQDAIDFMLETVKKYPGEVEIIAIGPATNIAKAIDKDPETMKRVKQIWSMGTSGLGPGNASPVAEFNVMHDAPAYRLMLEADIPVIIIGLDVCGGDALWSNTKFEKLKKTNDIGSFVVDAFSKLRDYDAKNGSPDASMNCDGLAMMCVAENDFVKREKDCHASCITDPGEVYGMVIFYLEGIIYNSVPNDFDDDITLVNEVDGAGFFERYLNAIR